MGDTTGIAWTGKTWNPWQGCRKVSEACSGCYMYRDVLKRGGDPSVVVRSKDPTFYAPLHWHEPDRIFVCSYSDFFIEEGDEWRDYAWDIIRRTPQHRYLILTKRPEKIASRLPNDWGDGYPHVALGVTAETQAMAEKRISLLLQNKAILYFVSAEPMLEELDFSPWLPQIGWVIVGGESVGRTKKDDTHVFDQHDHRRARYSDPAWFDSMRKQCEKAGTKFFLKQLGQVDSCSCGGKSDCKICGGKNLRLTTTPRAGKEAVINGHTYTEFPDAVMVASDSHKDESTYAAMVVKADAPDSICAKLIPLEDINLPETQVRYEVSPSSLKELKESIVSHGLLEPIVVAKSDDKYVLLHGQRRFRAFQELHDKHKQSGMADKWSHIPCVVRDDMPDEKRLLAEQLIENVQREDLSAIDRAEALRKYKELLGNDVPWSVVEKNLGISRRRREQLIRVMQLPIEVRSLIIEKGRTHGAWHFRERHARELLRLQHNGPKLKEIAEAMITNAWRHEQLVMEVDRALQADIEHHQVPPASSPTLHYETVLQALKSMPRDKAADVLRRLSADLATQNEESAS